MIVLFTEFKLEDKLRFDWIVCEDCMFTKSIESWDLQS